VKQFINEKTKEEVVLFSVYSHILHTVIEMESLVFCVVLFALKNLNLNVTMAFIEVCLESVGSVIDNVKNADLRGDDLITGS